MKFLEPGIHRLERKEEIGEIGKNKAYSFLYDYYPLQMVDRILYNIGWEWIDKHGKWCKRLAKAFKAEGRCISGDLLSKVGKIVREDLLANREIYMQIQIPSYDLIGNYGDDGSCYSEGGEYSAGIEVLKKNKGFHIGFLDIHNQPVGRCWGINNENFVIIFNGYSVDGETLNLEQMANLVGRILDRPEYEWCSLCNNGLYDGCLYINGPSGYLIGGQDVHDHKRWDLKVGIRCPSCGEIVYHNDLELVDGEWFCYSCENDSFFSCAECGCRTNDDNGYNFGNAESVYYCSDCYHQLRRLCEVCDNYFHKHYMNEINGRDICDNCYETHSVCEECNDIVLDEDAQCMWIANKGTEGESIICSDCAEKYEECIGCKKHYEKETMTDTYLGYVCHDCQSELIWCSECGDKEYGPMMSIFDNRKVCTFCYGVLKREREKLLKRQFKNVA